MKSESGFKGKVVVITGGGRGIGRSIAVACAREGAHVVVASRSAPEIEETVAEAKKQGGGNAIGVSCDVSKVADIQRLMGKARELGPIYGLICAAGIYGPIGTFEENPIEEWVKALEINLFGTVRAVHAVIGEMKKRGEGRVILFSGGGQGALPNFTSYVTGKGAILRFTETLGAELAPHGVFVNAISPGAVNTKFLDELLEAGPAKVGQVFYQKSMQQREQGGVPPEKAADLSVYLLSKASEGLWGRNLSAVWDKYWEIQDPKTVSASDLYTMRRVVDAKGGTRST